MYETIEKKTDLKEIKALKKEIFQKVDKVEFEVIKDLLTKKPDTFDLGSIILLFIILWST